ncbi:lac repressor [compost metagenome]
MSVVGFDDIDLAAYMTPALTTIRQDTAALGAGAARLLAELISRESHAAGGAGSPFEMLALTVPVELVVRESCRRLP